MLYGLIMPDFQPIPIENVKTARQLCEPVCVPIFIGKDHLDGHQAMGLLFAVADTHFPVTCRHAVHKVVARGAGLWVPDDNSPTAVPLTPKFHFGKSSLFDLAIMKLPDEFVNYFSAHRFARAVNTHSSVSLRAFLPSCIECSQRNLRRGMPRSHQMTQNFNQRFFWPNNDRGIGFRIY
jgi:hypothetical protein